MCDITRLSAVEISRQIQSGGLSSVEVVGAFLDRIEALNPRLNAIVSLRSRADILSDAARADSAAPTGWLHGMPMAIKDLAETAGITTTFGSPLFSGFVPGGDSLMVERLKRAGAILIGKTNTPEFGLGSHTFNPVFGPTRNPYDTARTPGGSSGGAAAALAARLLPVADGSDMMGSLRNPAAFCNVYGFRPSWGLVPDDPVGEMYLHQLATSGPMARSPGDIAALLDVMSGPDPRRPQAVSKPPELSDLGGPLGDVRIGWLGDWGGAYPMEDGIVQLCETALAGLERISCKIEPVPAPFDAAKLWQSWITLRSWAVASKMAPLYHDARSRAKLKPAMLWEIERGLGLSGQDIHRASEIRSDWLRRVNGLFDHYDALALPSAQVWPFPTDWVHPEQIKGQAMDSYHRWMEVVVPVSLIGLPCLALPAGFGQTGLPMGFQLFGAPGADLHILRLGQAYHDLYNWTEHAPPEGSQ